MKKPEKKEAIIPMTGMEKIYCGLGREHKPGDPADTDFIDAIYGLFEEYRETYYREEWERLDDNVTIYEGTYWGENDAEVIRPSAVRKHKGKYKLHFCGRTRLYPQSLIALGVLDKLGRALVGQCWDPKNPKAEYDVYVSLKLDKDGSFWISEVVLCGTGRDCPEQKSEEVPANG